MASIPSNRELLEALRLIRERCPRLSQACYWAGTSSIAIEEVGHRQSFDLDFHTRQALQDVRPMLAELQAAFPGRVRVVQAPDSFGSGFQCLLDVSGGNPVAVEVLSSYENVSERDIVEARSAPGMMRVTLARYLADKVQCVAERNEARDLVDIQAVLRYRPELEPELRRVLSEQDGLMLLERLVGWTNEGIDEDLAGYGDVDPADARACRDWLIGQVKGLGGYPGAEP